MANSKRTDGTILVTGGCGYLGSQLLRELVQAASPGQLTVRIMDNLQQQRFEALIDLPEGGHYQFIRGDILDPVTTRLALQGVDAVVHLAAVVKTPLSYERPPWVEQVNHWGTAHLLEYALEAGVKRFIYVSTTAVYGPGGPFSEDDHCRPQGAYAESKLRAEAAVQAAQLRGLQTTILRMGNIYGLAPITRFDAVANRFAYLAGVDRPLTVYGDGSQQRALIHVRDAAAAIRFTLARPEQMTAQIYNVVGDNTSILNLAETICRLKPKTSIQFTDQEIGTKFSVQATGDRLRKLGWQQQMSLTDGLADILLRFRHFEKMQLPTAEMFD